MKERPIIFSAPMVRAILDGRKTQTRRIVKPQPLAVAAPFHPEPRGGNRWVWMARDDAPGYSYATADFRCPCGAPSDRLWVRETWQAFFADEVPADRPRGPRHTMGIPAQPERESFVFYRADGDLSHPEDGSEAIWLSPLHMPRWASRLTLEIVSVRVERVQEISRADEVAEGTPDGMFFDCLWDSINAKRAPWDSNPWVWVIEFRRAGE